MKANVYTGFLTEKVKVYSTEKREKPRVISGRSLQRAIPVLLASMMSLTSSCTAKANNYQNNNNAVTVAVQDTLEDVFAPETEFLSEKEISALMENPAPSSLNDVNFNHLPENKENFWEIVRNGLQIINTQVADSKRLTDTQKAEYKITAYKMLSQISRVKGSVDDVDVRNFNNLKSFLYFEKVVQHKDRYWNVLSRSEGVIDERSDFFGRYYQDQEALRKKVDTHTGVQKFAKALYACDDRFVLSYNDSIQANEISRKMLADWFEKQKIEDKNLWLYADCEEYDYCNVLTVYRSRGKNLRIVLGVDPKGDLGDGFYSPIGSILIHELQHLGQQKPASRETPEDNHKADNEVNVQKVYFDDFSRELGPNLYSLAIEDKIYKEIHGLKADETVDYGDIDLGTHKVAIGEVAVWFGKMIEKHPHLSVDKLMAEPEVFNHINNLGNGANMQIMQKMRGGME